MVAIFIEQLGKGERAFWLEVLENSLRPKGEKKLPLKMIRLILTSEVTCNPRGRRTLSSGV